MIKIFIISFIAGSMQTIVGHPFDTIKTKIQLNNKNLQLNNKNLYTSLYAGFYPALLSGCIQNAYIFTIHDEINKITNNHFISGAISGVSTSFVVSPLENIKCNLQNKTKFKLKNLFSGLKYTIYRDSIGLGIYFFIYNKLEKNYGSFLSGGFAGLLSWIYSYPFDTIKTRIQTNNNLNLYNNLYKGFTIVAIRSFIVNSFIFMTYDKLIKYFNYHGLK